MAKGEIVKVVKSGRVTMYFHDDCCRDKTSEEIREMLDRIASIALPALKSAQIKKGKADLV